MKSLKNHPFAVQAHFESSIVLTFAVPKEQLLKLVPERLELDTFRDKWAFIAIAMVQTKGLRPKGFPQILGNDFFLIGYRIFVRYRNNDGKNLRGLFILKSETNKKKMELLGNIFTHYKYTTTDLATSTIDGVKNILSDQSQLEISIKETDGDVLLPKNSPFTDWREARKFAGPLPHTFTVNSKEKTILTVLGVRQNWKPKPIHVTSYKIGFLDQLEFSNVVLASAFEIKDIPYHWKKGKIEKWN